MVSVQLPYFDPNLPHPLPTNSEINEAPVLIEHNGYRVVRVGAHYVVKYGSSLQLDLIEGENMLFIRQATTIPVPRVYALYTDPIKSINYIVMEFIEGELLSTQWPHLTADEKSNIVATLRRYFNQLRNLRSPGYYGSIGKRPLQDGIFWTPKPRPEINGPFESEDAMNTAMTLKYLSQSETQSTYRADFYRRALANVYRGHEPKFTHGDFQRKNVIIRRIDASSNNFEVVLVDWQTSGWYPSYWEYSMATLAAGWDDDWHQSVSLVLDSFDAEFPWLNLLYQEIWF
ncbi:hypothetical protein PRK78_003234 [Emydomyces testavorans]|uniref:Aminoglycoside phosphotransferase domain-containing protein n=1 Tax=Emydomyces testavorans TaxID=2070801 RepID=A0AAF0DFU4_9EURO|nr:hypothetical protein PRK78_003234 [Emydomyces testavorans]